ncbi:MAG: DUF5119 domain-containing protein [Muribaculaceae bacterium]|nr:DUF5119 domain-containing protein [Muribaculaceae bacterium]
MKTNRIFFLCLSVMAMMLTSCRHKDLCYDHSHRSSVRVVFDWEEAPDANPTSMLSYFFPEYDGEPMIYTFAGREGGNISIPFGNYNSITISGDNTDWATLLNTANPLGFKVITKDAERLEGYGLSVSVLPRARGSEAERVALVPGIMWHDHLEEIDIPVELTGEKVITYRPHEIVSHYTVDVINVKNLENLRGSQIDGTISGMAEGYYPRKETSSDESVTFPFVLKSVTDNKSLHSEFLTFGECPNQRLNHNVTIYVLLNDGTKWFKTFDVTDQVRNAPDPRNVHIVIDGLELPKPIANGGGGFKPEVNDWNDIEIYIKM